MPSPGLSSQSIDELERRRRARHWKARLRRLLEPPSPYVMNPHEPKDFPLGRFNLYIGGAAAVTQGYINIDLFPTPGVDVVCNAELLPFKSGVFTRIECDAVLEHVQRPEVMMAEMERVLAPGGYLHLVTPFCHPFHEYPKDYRRYTVDGLKALAGPRLEAVAEGWRTGPTATLLVFVIEYVKLLGSARWWRALAHGVLGWLLFPLRYLDLLLLRTGRAGRMGNHCYLWLRKPSGDQLK